MDYTNKPIALIAGGLIVISVALLLLFKDNQPPQSSVTPLPAVDLSPLNEPDAAPQASKASESQKTSPLNDTLSELSELQRLSAPIEEPTHLYPESPEQLQQEAELLIQQTDELVRQLSQGNLPSSPLSATELAEIEQQPEFKRTLERETELQERLRAID